MKFLSEEWRVYEPEYQKDARIARINPQNFVVWFGDGTTALLIRWVTMLGYDDQGIPYTEMLIRPSFELTRLFDIKRHLMGTFDTIRVRFYSEYVQILRFEPSVIVIFVACNVLGDETTFIKRDNVLRYVRMLEKELASYRDAVGYLLDEKRLLLEQGEALARRYKEMARHFNSRGESQSDEGGSGGTQKQ